MSSDVRKTRAETLGALIRELRESIGFGESFLRAAAARVGMPVTDLQVLEILDGGGPMTAGQLAELTGLTTGAVTGMLNRLEESGLVLRESDPSDGRRVIVRLAPGKGESSEARSIFAALERAWEELAASYDDAQIAVLAEFLGRSNALSQAEILRLRQAPTGEEGIFSSPLEGIKSGRLVLPTGAVRVMLDADATMADLYRARFEGPPPDVKVEGGDISVRYSRRKLLVDWRQRAAEITLNATIPWQIELRGGAFEVNGKLGNLDLAGLEIKGGMSTLKLALSMPARVVPIRISGGAAEILIRRPEGAAATAHIKGWASVFKFDGQSQLGKDIRMQSPGFDATSPHYDIEIASSASVVRVTAE